MHPSSVLHRVRPQWVVFATAQQGDSGWFEMQGVTAIDPDWLVEACPQMFHKAGS
jgi:ATP-dependent RNA helicase DDX35